MQRVRYRGSIRAVSLPGWLMGLIGIGIVAAVLALLLVGLIVSIVIIPAAIIGSLVLSWRLRRLLRASNRPMQSPPGRDRVIEGDYTVLKDPDPRRP